MKLILGVLFLGLFSLNTRAGIDFVDSPAHCFSQKKYPCHIRASSGVMSFEKDGQKFRLGEKSSLLLNSSSEIQLMQGQLWILKSEDLTVKSTSALLMKVSGEWFFEKQSDNTLLVRNLNGEVEFKSRYVFSNEALPVGFQNWFGGLDSMGQVSRGVIRPIVETDFLKVWIPLSGYSMAELRKSFYAYRELWSGALEKSAKLYQEIVERRMASQDDRARRQAQAQKAVKDEQSELRKLYREKNGL